MSYKIIATPKFKRKFKRQRWRKGYYTYYSKGKIVFLLYIFDKSEQENISDKELLLLLKDIK